MKMKKILPIALILLIGLSALVYAAQGPFYTKYPINFEKGWNLVYGFADPQQLKEYGVEGNIKVVYAFIPTIQEYARTWPNPESDKVRLIDDDELLNTAFWVYSDEKMNTKYQLLEETIPFNERPIYAGWNFVGITSDMYQGTYVPGVGYEGEYFSWDAIKGNCQYEKIYGWHVEFQKWAEMDPNHKLKGYDFDDFLGNGMVVKVSNNCNLGSTGGVITPPPSLPDSGTPSTTGCRDSDGGLDYTERGTITGIEVSRTMNEKLINEGSRYSGLEVTSEITARLKLSEITYSMDVSVGNTYAFDFANIYINDIDFFGIGDSRNNLELTIVSVTDFCKQGELIEWVCDSQDPSGYDDEHYICPNGCSNGECI